MHATIRRYEGVDFARNEELTKRVREGLLPQLRKLDGFSGYYLIEAGNGVLSSFGLFKEPTQVDEATFSVQSLAPDRAAVTGTIIPVSGDYGLLSGAIEGHLPAAAREVSDVTGAGDTVIATLAVMLAAGATMSEAARLANEAAGIVVAKFGPATASTPELLAAIDAHAGV